MIFHSFLHLPERKTLLSKTKTRYTCKMMSIPENIVEMGKAALAELDKAMATNKQLLSFPKKITLF